MHNTNPWIKKTRLKDKFEAKDKVKLWVFVCAIDCDDNH